MNVIELVIKMKKDTQSHYERLAEAVEGGELKRLFSLFASAEREHVEKLTQLEQGLGKIDDRVLERLNKRVCAFTPDVDLFSLAKAMRSDTDACRYAEHEEGEIIDLLDHLSSQEDREKLKSVFHLLADKERDHLKMLEEIYSFVERPKFYLEWGEFSNLKGL